MSSAGSSGPNSWHALLIQAAGKGDEAKVRHLLAQLYPREEIFKDALRIALQRVAGRGHQALTRLLLEHGAEVNEVLDGEIPPLHKAAETGRDDILKLLLDKGADVNVRDKNHRTPIFPAAQRNHQKALQLLLHGGADVNAKGDDYQTLMLCLATERSEKLMRWGTEIIQLLLGTSLDLEAKDKDGRTALLWAAATGKESLAKLLLSGRTENIADIHATNYRGKTALHLAVENRTNRIPLIKLLLENGANVHAKSDGGWTPLHNAAEKGYEDVASLLLDWGANVNTTTSSGMTALHWCARNGHIGTVKLLLKQSGIRIHRKDSFDETPMLGAAQNGHIEIVRLLSPANDGTNLSLAARLACNGFQATVIDFGMEHRSMNHRKYPVFDLLYGWDQEKQKPIVTTLVRNIPAKPAFRWIHLPTNNITWVETLITKHFVENSASDLDGFKALEKLLGQQHRGPKVHSFFMRPLCQRMQPTGRDPSSSRPPVAEGEESQTKTEPTTPVIMLPEQENPVSQDRKTSLYRHDKSSTQSERKPKIYNTLQSPKSSVPSTKKSREIAGQSTTPSKKRADSQRDQRKTPIDKKSDRKGNIVLFMPYLHYETHRNRKAMSKAIKKASEDEDNLMLKPHEGHSCDEMLIQAYLRSTPNLHIRRTLDQFYYHAISTDQRDKDQVVYRYTRDKNKEKKVFMVDQLWLWILGKDLIITSFPQRWNQPKNDPLNVLDGIIEDMNSKTRPPVRSVHDLATLITGRCSGVFDRHRLGDEDYQFLDMFESSIGQVTNTETDLFKKFNKASEKAEEWLQLQRQRGSPQLRHASSARDHDFVDTLLDIGEETALLAETKDIRDELNMICLVLEHQLSVLDDMMSALLEEAKHQPQIQSEVRRRYREQQKLVEVHIKDVERMDKQAEGIYTSLTHLLDLKQKHANAFEARFARDQAALTGRQGQTIMVFTLVTIVFLPMSFIASVFAIPVRDYPHRDGNLSIPFSYVSKIMFGVGLAISIPLIAVALSFDNLGLLVRQGLRSTLLWVASAQDSPSSRRGSVSQRKEPEDEVESDDDEGKPTRLARTSEDAWRRRVSYDVERETRPMRRSIYSKERSSLRASADLERGDHHGALQNKTNQGRYST